MSTTSQNTATYYQNLLIAQYLTKPRASAMIYTCALPMLMPDSNIQLITFLASNAGVPASGSFVLAYNGVSTSSIAYSASNSTIQSDVNAVLSSGVTCVVTGSIAAGLTITFSGYTSAVSILTIISNSLADSASKNLVGLIAPIGNQLQGEIQSAFNISTASGQQLNILGKYAGVSRSGNGFYGPVTLDDADFLTLIQIAIIQNSAGSSLLAIQQLLNEFFPGEIYVFDYRNMNMSYLINTSIGSQNLVQLFVTEGVLPHPMGVGVSVVAAPVINEFFGFVTYDVTTNPLGTPFNTYDSYSNTWQWISYSDAVVPP